MTSRWNKSVGISIHALCEEGDTFDEKSGLFVNISIHALCEEGDVGDHRQDKSRQQFLSTPSARRATFNPRCNLNRLMISIHALCEEGDRPK